MFGPINKKKIKSTKHRNQSSFMRIVLFTTKVGSLVKKNRKLLKNGTKKWYLIFYRYWTPKYQWTDFRRKQNNPHKRTLISMFCWLIFFFFFSCLLDQTPSSVYRKPKFMEIREKLRVFISIFIELILFTQPGFKGKL